MRCRNWSVWAGILCVAGGMTCRAADWHVAMNGNDAADGTSWATAKQTIQAGVDAAADGDTVWVSRGVYGNGLRDGNRVVVPRSIFLRSVNGPEVTVIDGGNNARGVYMETNAVLDGFTVRGGYADSGGGVLCSFSNAVLTNCVITGNSASAGGGSFGGSLYSCIIKNNHATEEGGGSYNSMMFGCIVEDNVAVVGAGMFGGSMYQCMVVQNYSHDEGGGVARGILNQCALIKNRSNGFGGGSSESTLTGCHVISNTCGEAGGGAYACTLNNCLVVDNRAEDIGGAAWSTLNNCTVTGNHSNRGGGGAGNSTLYNCIVYGNNNGNLTACICQNTCSLPQPEGVANIAENPQFKDAEGGDYRLLATSPCIGAGDNKFVQAENDLDGNPLIMGGKVDMGAYESPMLAIEDLEVKRSASPAARSFRSCRFVMRMQGPRTNLGTVRVEFYISRDKVFGNDDDRKIGRSIWSNVWMPGGGRPRTFTYPTNELYQVSSFWRPGLAGTGPYYLFAVADVPGAKGQLWSHGWTRTAEAFRYYAGRSQVDWVLRNLRVTRPANADSRRFKSCQFELVNHGPVRASGDVRVEFYLSRDTTFGDGDDRKIGETTLAGLTMDSQARRTFTLGRTRLTQMTRQWTAGLAGDGMYYVFARAMAQSGFELREGDNHASTPSRFRYSTAARSAKGDGAMSLEKAPVLAWARSGGEWRLAPELVDGDTNGVWTGMEGSAPWAVAVDFRRTVRLGGVETLFDGEPWSRGGMLGTEDLLEWFDLGLVTNWPVPCRAIFLELQEEAGEAPAIREIRWEEEP